VSELGSEADDFFAGAGGLDIPARARGWQVTGYENMPEARETRARNGFKTAETEDVRDVETAPGQAVLQMGGPPCPPFSRGGKGHGTAALAAVLAGVQRLRAGQDPDYAGLLAQTGDERVALVLQPLRLALAGRPLFLLWEQVPQVLPVWQACGTVLGEHGYSVATGVLNAADYGAPQLRKRAVLLARRDGRRAELPEPTVARYTTMAEALGWGMTHRPSYTVTGGGTYTGGAEPFGPQARQGMRREFEAGRWVGPERYRVTDREAAILQGFPPGFVFSGGAGKRFMQIGNAVPLHLASALLAQFPMPGGR
jgi:DNA (cytosine-5)-methyltransferase 1